MRVGIASQTPLVRMKRGLDELEARHGPLGDPVPLDRLERGVDYSVTPGGVGRMIGGIIEECALQGDWVTLDQGFPRDLALGGFRLRSARMDPAAQKAYGQAKEIAWEAENGLPPRVADPLHDAAFLESYGAWSRANHEVLARLHAEDPFDVLYINDWQHLPHGRLPRDVPAVMHFHAPFAPWQAPGWRALIRDHLEAFDAVLVSTHGWSQELRRAGVSVPVHQVYPWIDPRDYAPPASTDVADFEEKWHLEGDDEVVLNVGRMDPVKAQDRLIRAFAHVARRRPRAKLVLVGNGSFSSSKRAGIGLSKGAQWRDKLEGMVAELGLEERVVFTGHMPHRQVVPAFHRADVFCFPSVGEGFGLAVAEAWLAGRPAVVSRAAGIAEIVRDGANGLVVDTQDDVALGEALERLLAHPEEARRMGEEGRRTALEVCDVRRRAPEVCEVLRAVGEDRRLDLRERAVAG